MYHTQTAQDMEVIFNLSQERLSLGTVRMVTVEVNYTHYMFLQTNKIGL